MGEIRIRIDGVVAGAGCVLGRTIVLVRMTCVMRKACASSCLRPPLEYSCRLDSIGGTVRIVGKEIVGLDSLCFMRLLQPGPDILACLAIFKLYAIESKDKKRVSKSITKANNATKFLPVRNLVRLPSRLAPVFQSVAEI